MGWCCRSSTLLLRIWVSALPDRIQLQRGGKGPELLQALGELRRQVCKPGFPIQLSLSEGVRLASTIALAKAEDFELLTRKFDFWAPQRRATGEAWPFPLTAARRFSDVTHPTTKLLIIY